MNRDIVDVAKRIRPLLIQGGLGVGGFDAIVRSVGFTAPEMMHPRWVELCDWLVVNLPPPVMGAPEWVLEVSNIIEGRS